MFVLWGGFKHTEQCIALITQQVTSYIVIAIHSSRTLPVFHFLSLVLLTLGKHVIFS